MAIMIGNSIASIKNGGISEPTLKLAWVSRGDADAFCGDSSSLNDWNAALGTNFTTFVDGGATFIFGGQTGVILQTAFGGFGLTEIEDIGGIIVEFSATNMFDSCTFLTRVILTGIAVANDNIFSNCTSINYIDIRSVGSLGTDVFSGITGQTITLIIDSSQNTKTQVIALQAVNTVTIINP